jgi:hypothetical protein
MKKCKYCGKNFNATRKGKVYCSKNCRWKASKTRICGSVTNAAKVQKGDIYVLLIKKDKCSNCGFVPVHSCQLDIHHKDGNHKNNCVDNLQVLCANCHRLTNLK